MSVRQKNLRSARNGFTLIETMVAEGRRTTESWGWTFVLWGVAYLGATAWASLGRSNLACPVTMIAAAIATGANSNAYDYFYVTPAGNITAIITERGVFRPADLVRHFTGRFAVRAVAVDLQDEVVRLQARRFCRTGY